MKTIPNNAEFVWGRGQRWQVIPASVNQNSRCLNVFCGDYNNMGFPKCLSFDEIDEVE